MGNSLWKRMDQYINEFVLKSSIPESRIILIDNHQVCITKSRFILSQKRKFLETLCVLDLLRHERFNKKLFGPSILVLVSEQAYFDALCMIDHINIPESIIHQALMKYPQNIRVTSDAVKAYSPVSEFIYIQFND
jgi:hypothetical protein